VRNRLATSARAARRLLSRAARSQALSRRLPAWSLKSKKRAAHAAEFSRRLNDELTWGGEGGSARPNGRRRSDAPRVWLRWIVSRTALSARQPIAIVRRLLLPSLSP